MPNQIKKGPITGIVQWFDTMKGVGFIKTDEGNFVKVHYSNLPIKDGDFIIVKANQRVKFDIYEDINGPEAKNIVIVQ